MSSKKPKTLLKHSIKVNLSEKRLGHSCKSFNDLQLVFIVGKNLRIQNFRANDKLLVVLAVINLVDKTVEFY